MSQEYASLPLDCTGDGHEFAEEVADCRTCTGQAALWIAIGTELGKGTPLGLITAFIHIERWIETNRTNVTPEDILAAAGLWVSWVVTR